MAKAVWIIWGTNSADIEQLGQYRIKSANTDRIWPIQLCQQWWRHLVVIKKWGQLSYLFLFQSKQTCRTWFDQKFINTVSCIFCLIPKFSSTDTRSKINKIDINLVISYWPYYMSWVSWPRICNWANTKLLDS